MKKLYRSADNRILGGVCGGLADAYGWDVSLIRLAWAFLALIYGTGALMYLAAWVIIPQE